MKRNPDDREIEGADNEDRMIRFKAGLRALACESVNVIPSSPKEERDSWILLSRVSPSVGS